MIYSMPVCEKCGAPASRSIIRREGEGVTKINYYCENHTPKSENS